MKQAELQLSFLLPALCGFLLVPSSLAYKWPNPQIDEADAQLYNQFGHKGNQIFRVGVPFCARSPAPNSGRQVAAEWVRTAFHDMATHDAAAGTGGMDGSIALEANRAENVGKGMGGTVGFFLNFVTENLSLADLLALGVRTALDACNGPEVPFRVGRVDDLTPGPFGVPTADQNLETHISTFHKLGFNQEEMIGLVACGHTIGGVHATFSPDIVPQSAITPSNTEGVVHFDSTFDVYDNKIATEFVSGVRNNPLAFGANDTTNSDFRIFSSDGNATISSFAASQDAFFSTCASLLARMIDTVPSHVTLSNVINPVPVKPSIFLDLQEDGRLSLSGDVRFFDMQTNTNRVVKFVWLDRDGQCTEGVCSATATHDENQVTTTTRQKQALWYSFDTIIDSSASISVFWFEIDEGDGSGPKQVFGENGTPFPVEDRLFIIPSKSCEQDDSSRNIAITFAVRSGTQVVDPKIVGAGFTIAPPIYTRSEISATATLSSNSPSHNYQLFTANFQTTADNFQFDIVAQIDGQNVNDAGWSSNDISDPRFQCPPPESGQSLALVVQSLLKFIAI